MVKDQGGRKMVSRGDCFRFMGLIGYSREEAIHIFHADVKPDEKALCELIGHERLVFLAELVGENGKEVKQRVKKDLGL